MKLDTNPTIKPKPIKIKDTDGIVTWKMLYNNIPINVIVNNTIDKILFGTAFLNLETAIKSKTITPMDNPLNAACIIVHDINVS